MSATGVPIVFPHKWVAIGSLCYHMGLMMADSLRPPLWGRTSRPMGITNGAPNLLIFLLGAAVLLIRFIRTGGLPMLKMMNTPEHEMSHHDMDRERYSH